MTDKEAPFVVEFDSSWLCEEWNGKWCYGQPNWVTIPRNADEAYMKAVRDYASTMPAGGPLFVEVGLEVWNESHNAGNEHWNPPGLSSVGNERWSPDFSLRTIPRVLQSPAERARRQFAKQKWRG